MSVRGPAIKLAIFVLSGALVAGLLYLTLGRITIGPSRSYDALMSDVSGLEKGDLVRVAGVRVGQVDGLSVESGNVVRVSFHVDDQQQLTDRTQVLVRYENLLGDRYLELAQPPAAGNPLTAGATIPVDRTTPALDLDVLLNGFRPLFEGLEPQQVNTLATNLIATLQGRGGTVQSLLASTASLTNGLADNDKVIGSLLTNLDVVLGSLDSRDVQLDHALREMKSLVAGLSNDRDPIGRSVTSINQFAATLGGLVAEVRPPLSQTVTATDDAAAVINRNSARLDQILDSLPDAYQVLGRVGSHGTFFNFFLCSVQVVVSGANGNIETPVVRSGVERCN